MFFFPIAILAIKDETEREFMKELYISHSMNMFRIARSLTKSAAEAK
ncbi:MAG: hypothetical protein PHI27_02270 [Eubacteriales bacterium]|nr:hypothetical protein [Eubacteriales bacterium]MDD3881059.1 hypothetical protein [Eubacteriales bacterium]MDD4511872.1 hypothetical protein [Eubacteriales bacterium]